MPALGLISLPRHATNLESLRKLPNLKRLSFGYENGPACTAENFWKTWDGASARKLEAAGIDFDIRQQPDGSYEAAVHDPKFTDCAVFKGSNVRRLDLERSGVVDLKPLAELPLQALDIRETSVTDLSPLRSTVLGQAMRIRLWRSKVADFSPIAGCVNLELFDAADMVITDLSFLKGMKLTRSCSPAPRCRTSRSWPACRWSGSISSAPRSPTSRRCSSARRSRAWASPRIRRTSNRSAPVETGATLLLRFRRHPRQVRLPILGRLRGRRALDRLAPTGEHHVQAGRLADKSWEVILDDQPITDLSLLKGGSITQLSIMRMPVADLSPLRGMKLKALKMSGSKVTDLSPIKGMPLTSVNISGTEVRDLTPLTGMPLRSLYMTSGELITDLSPLAGMADTLETMILPTNATDVAFLRASRNSRG